MDRLGLRGRRRRRSVVQLWEEERVRKEGSKKQEKIHKLGRSDRLSLGRRRKLGCIQISGRRY